MAEKYVENGYVENGYVEGGEKVFNLSTGSVVKMSFFISNGDVEEETLLADIMGDLSDVEVGVVYLPNVGKTILADKTNFFEFKGNLDADEVRNIIMGDTIFQQSFVDNVIENTTIINDAKEQIVSDMCVTIKGADGSIIASATVTQTGSKTFDVTIPSNLVGTSYTMSFDSDCNA